MGFLFHRERVREQTISVLDEKEQTQKRITVVFEDTSPNKPLFNPDNIQHTDAAPHAELLASTQNRRGAPHNACCPSCTHAQRVNAGPDDTTVTLVQTLHAIQQYTITIALLFLILIFFIFVRALETKSEMSGKKENLLPMHHDFKFG